MIGGNAEPETDSSTASSPRRPIPNCYLVPDSRVLAGEYPGDGLPKPVSFPDPATAAVHLNGIPCVNLQTLVELKIASGMTGVGRLKDLADVEQLIIILKLPREFARQLNPYVQAKYDELWMSAQPRDESKKD